TDQTIEYAIGVWGKEGAALMDGNVKDKILGRPRAREITERKLPQQTLRELRRKHGGQGVSDEEILLRFFTSKNEVEQMHAAGPARIYTAHNPLLTLIEELTKQVHPTTVYIQKGALSLRLKKRRLPT
ncbi:MAG: biotin carboxyl carrier protein, partial [Deltaproteobacteria bacterium]